jgi:hypothetical protein
MNSSSANIRKVSGSPKLQATERICLRLRLSRNLSGPQKLILRGWAEETDRQEKCLLCSLTEGDLEKLRLPLDRRELLSSRVVATCLILRVKMPKSSRLL